MRLPLSLAATLAALMSTPADARWPYCIGGEADDCRPVYLNVVTRQGNARLSVDNHCRADWRHVWGQNDARGAIRQWLGDNAANGSGWLCVELGPEVDKVRIISTGGHCGETATVPDMATASEPGPDMILRRSYAGARVATLRGCHATIGTGENEVAYGGIALNFADGFGFGDSYARGHFYGVYDGFGMGRVRPFGATVRAISDFNTFHYRVEVLADGRALRARLSEDTDR